MNKSEIINLLKTNYEIEVLSISFFQRGRIDYSSSDSRQVYDIVDNKNNYFILKVIDYEKYFEGMFTQLKMDKFDYTIYPEINIHNKYTTQSNNKSLLLFKKHNLTSVNYTTDFNYLNIYTQLFHSLSNIDEELFHNNYINNLQYFIEFSKKSPQFPFILKHFNVTSDYFYQTIHQYLNFIKNQKLNIIYSSLWDGNIFKEKDKIYFIDLDSIKKGDIYYDMIQMLLIVYINFDDINQRHKLYENIYITFQQLSQYKIFDKSVLVGLLYYFSFVTYIDIVRGKDELNIVLYDIYHNMMFVNDFIDFIDIYDDKL